MNKRELALLERAFKQEVAAAMRGSPLDLIQPRGKLVQTLVARGLMEPASRRDGVFLYRGYVLTHAGRMAYCETCDGGWRAE
jgi:hypothetical protein